tara:strand:- start:6913 stop:7914 length:1002 start_codon:yes stop_codon:yes gene_type:complete
MAIYKTTSAQVILRKVMRDLNPEGADWLDDGIEWIGEALEHIGASAQLESRTCIVDIKDHKGPLPADLYYINQVSINESQDAVSVSSQINQVNKDIQDLSSTYKFSKDFISSTLNKLADGTISSTLAKSTLADIETLNKTGDQSLNKLLANSYVLYNQYMSPSTGNLQPLRYCTGTFPEAIHCDDCTQNYHASSECYLVESDRIKTSFAEGKVCLSYKAMPTDVDCFPLVPDDISYKEAMFWYIYKKMLLGGMQTTNGIAYDFADNKWKYYCTQARNAAVYPDIERMENWMNQWVRLVPNINRYANGFENLAQRESLDRAPNFATMNTKTDIL